jgi:hypothetical protein
MWQLFTRCAYYVVLHDKCCSASTADVSCAATRLSVRSFLALLLFMLLSQQYNDILPSRTLKGVINVSGTLIDAVEVVPMLENLNMQVSLSKLDDDYSNSYTDKTRTLNIKRLDSSMSSDEKQAVLDGLKPGGSVDLVVVLRKGVRGVFDANIKSSTFAESLPKHVSQL